MYCVKCGIELLADAKFCTSCGSDTVTATNTVSDVHKVGDRVMDVPQVQPRTEGRTNQLILGLAAVVLLAGGGYWYQVERNIVRAPDYKVGDKWTFEYSPPDIDPSKLTSGSEMEKRLLADHEPMRTYEVTKGDDLELYAKKVTGKLDGWPGFPLPLWKSYDTKYDEQYPFPLFPGKTWSNNKSISGSAGSTTHENTYKVGEWESLTVPAGTFRVIPVILTTKTKYALKSVPPREFNNVVVRWYAPDAKIEVKHVLNGKQMKQLESYSPQ